MLHKNTRQTAILGSKYRLHQNSVQKKIRKLHMKVSKQHSCERWQIKFK